MLWRKSSAVAALLLAMCCAQTWAATKYWRGGAGAVKQVDTITPANVEIGDVFTVAINSKSVSFTATAATVANVTAGLVAACGASTVPPEFGEVSFTDATTHVTATAATAGTPFTLTSSATDGGGANTQTLTRAAVTASKGPYHWDDAANWSGAAVPGAGDTIIVERGSWNILYGLDAFAGTTFAELRIQQFTGRFGLPVMNAYGYTEYRARAVQAGFTLVNVGSPDGSGLNSGLIRVDGQAVQTTLNVYGTSTPLEAHAGALEWVGTHASNVVNVYRGNVRIAPLASDAATVATLKIGAVDSPASDVLCNCGTGLTLANVTQWAGLLGLRSNPSGTSTLYGGTTYMLRGCTSLGTLDLHGGTIRGAQ